MNQQAPAQALPPTLAAGRRPPTLLPRALALAAALMLGACALPQGPGGVGDPTSPSPGQPATGAEMPVAPAAPVAEASAVPAAPPVAVAAATPEATSLPAPQAVDPLQPNKPLALDRDEARLDLWVRVRRGVAMPNLSDAYVGKWEQYYAGKPDYVARMMDRGGRYLFHVMEEIDKRGMPSELALLPFIESAFNPQAHSVASASGMWQFIPGTGRDYKLRQNLFRDERRDVLASTRAALDYLTKLHGMFNDWHLALAAYNWGEGSVKRAISRNAAAGLPTDYESLRMPAETRNYVPKLQAVKNIVLEPQRFGLSLPPLHNHPYFLQVAIDRDIDVDRCAQLAGLPLDEFKALNPQMNKPVILAAGTPQVLLPYDNANRFVRALMEHRGPLASWTAWIAPRALKPQDAARLLRITEQQLRQVNHIPAGMMVRAGSTLLVPRTAHLDRDVAGEIADNATVGYAPVPPDFLRHVSHAPRKGTTVAAVAHQHGVSASQVAQWNPHARKGRFKRGQAIVILTPNPAARAYAQGVAELRGRGTALFAAPAAGTRRPGRPESGEASPTGPALGAESAATQAAAPPAAQPLAQAPSSPVVPALATATVAAAAVTAVTAAAKPAAGPPVARMAAAPEAAEPASRPVDERERTRQAAMQAMREGRTAPVEAAAPPAPNVRQAKAADDRAMPARAEPRRVVARDDDDDAPRARPAVGKAAGDRSAAADTKPDLKTAIKAKADAKADAKAHAKADTKVAAKGKTAKAKAAPDEDDDAPPARAASKSARKAEAAKTASAAGAKRVKGKAAAEDDEDDDAPKARKAAGNATAKADAKAARSARDDGRDKRDPKVANADRKAPAKAATKAKGKVAEDDDDDRSAASRRAAARTGRESSRVARNAG